MNKTIRLFILLAALACFAFGQTTLTTTTLSAAVSSASAKTLTVASATGFNAQNIAASLGTIGAPATAAETLMYVDREAMLITGVNSTTITVVRGWGGTPATPHASGATVIVGPAGAFVQRAPSGSCTRTALAYVPLVEIPTGAMFDCYNGSFGSFTAPGGPRVGATVASVAGTTNIIAPVTVVSGTNAITAFGLPPSMPVGGCFTIVPSGAYTTTATNNIGKASTGVVGVSQIWCQASDGKVYPSY